MENLELAILGFGESIGEEDENSTNKI